jgi:hypothetical protein
VRGSSPLNCKTLKHVSAFMVICLGGGAGNESVYAEDVPKGSVIIVLRCSVGMVCMFEYGLLCSVILGAAACLSLMSMMNCVVAMKSSRLIHYTSRLVPELISTIEVPHAVTPIA